MYNPIPEPEMYRLMAESCQDNKSGKTNYGFVPFTGQEIEEFLKESEE